MASAPVTTGASIRLYLHGRGLHASIVITKLLVDNTLATAVPNDDLSRVATTLTVYMPAIVESIV